jgi:hypothetical protein
MASFDSTIPEIDPFILDAAYSRAINLVELSIATWRGMRVPSEILEIAGETAREDEYFFRGGAIALEALKLELEAERATQFLS